MTLGFGQFCLSTCVGLDGLGSRHLLSDLRSWKLTLSTLEVCGCRFWVFGILELCEFAHFSILYFTTRVFHGLRACRFWVFGFGSLGAWEFSGATFEVSRFTHVPSLKFTMMFLAYFWFDHDGWHFVYAISQFIVLDLAIPFKNKLDWYKGIQCSYLGQYCHFNWK